MTGDKHLCKGLEWTLWTTEGIPLLEWEVIRGTAALPWMEPLPEGWHDLGVYYDGIHRGAMRKEGGRMMWTDGSMRTVKGMARAGAGWVDGS